MINLPATRPQMLLVYRKSDCTVVNVAGGLLKPQNTPEDFGYSSAEYAILEKLPLDYVREAHKYVLRQLPGRVALLLRPYYLHVSAVSGCTIELGSDAPIVSTYQARIPVGQECIFKIEKRGTTRHEVCDSSDQIKVAVPLGVPVRDPQPPVLQLMHGMGLVRLGVFEFPATLETHVYPLENAADTIDCRLFMHFHQKV
jgi:hypothetical protein